MDDANVYLTIRLLTSSMTSSTECPETVLAVCWMHSGEKSAPFSSHHKSDLSARFCTSLINSGFSTVLYAIGWNHARRQVGLTSSVLLAGNFCALAFLDGWCSWCRYSSCLFLFLLCQWYRLTEHSASVTGSQKRSPYRSLTDCRESRYSFE